MTRAPSAFAIASAAVETPLPMPHVKTHSPSCSRARVTSIRYAVSKTSGNAAASSKLRSPGMGWTFVSGTAISSAFVPSPCSPITWIAPVGVSMPGLITTRSPVSTRMPAPSAPRMRGFGTDGQAFADPDVEMVQRGGVQPDEHFSRRRHRIGHLFEDENLGAAVLMDPHRAHRGRLSG